MMENGFLKKILYKKAYAGLIEKDGKKYRKYKKVRRFSPFFIKIMLFLASVAILLIGALIFIKFSGCNNTQIGESQIIYE